MHAEIFQRIVARVCASIPPPYRGHPIWAAAHRRLVHFQKNPVLAIRANPGERRERQRRRIARGTLVGKDRRQRLDDQIDDALDLAEAGFCCDRGNRIEDRTERSGDLDRTERPSFCGMCSSCV